MYASLLVLHWLNKRDSKILFNIRMINKSNALQHHILYNTCTVNSRYLEVDGTIFYKFKLPEVQIYLHFG